MYFEAPVFAVTAFITLGILIALLVIEVVAFVNCLLQRADAFPVVGPLSKTAWLAILGGGILLTLVCSLSSWRFSLFTFVAAIAAALYLLDVRPALRDAAEGSGPW